MRTSGCVPGSTFTRFDERESAPLRAARSRGELSPWDQLMMLHVLALLTSYMLSDDRAE
jgi:hypothetical protein